MTEETEKSIREFCQQNSGPNTIINQLRDNLAILSTLIKAATEQANQFNQAVVASSNPLR